MTKMFNEFLLEKGILECIKACKIFPELKK